MPEIFIFLQKYVNLEGKTQHVVITHANTSNGIKIPIFLGKSWGMMLHLSSTPLTQKHLSTYLNSYLQHTDISMQIQI